MHLKVCLSRRRASHGAGRHRTFGAQSELTGEQFVLSALIHHQQDQVRHRAANLKANAAALDTDRGGRRPAFAILVTAGQVPFSVFAADDESRRLETWHNDDAVRLVEQILRNSLVGCRHYLRKDRRSLAQPFGRLLVDRQ